MASECMECVEGRAVALGLCSHCLAGEPVEAVVGQIARLARELEESRRERSAARAEVLTAQASLRRVERELEEAREREREAATDIDLAWQFVATARRDYQPGDEGYNDCIEQAEGLLWRARKTLAATPDAEGET